MMEECGGRPLGDFPGVGQNLKNKKWQKMGPLIQKGDEQLHPHAEDLKTEVDSEGQATQKESSDSRKHISEKIEKIMNTMSEIVRKGEDQSHSPADELRQGIDSEGQNIQTDGGGQMKVLEVVDAFGKKSVLFEYLKVLNAWFEIEQEHADVKQVKCGNKTEANAGLKEQRDDTKRIGENAGD